MSDVKVVRYLLAHNAGLNAEVPAARITPGVIPQGAVLPAIGVTHVSSRRPQGVAAGQGIVFSRVQVTVHAETYPQLEELMPLVRAALPRSRGTVNGVAVDGVVMDIEGPDFRDDEAGIYARSQDVIVTYTE